MLVYPIGRVREVHRVLPWGRDAVVVPTACGKAANLRLISLDVDET